MMRPIIYPAIFSHLISIIRHKRDLGCLTSVNYIVIGILLSYFPLLRLIHLFKNYLNFLLFFFSLRCIIFDHQIGTWSHLEIKHDSRFFVFLGRLQIGDFIINFFLVICPLGRILVISLFFYILFFLREELLILYGYLLLL